MSQTHCRILSTEATNILTFTNQPNKQRLPITPQMIYSRQAEPKPTVIRVAVPKAFKCNCYLTSRKVKAASKNGVPMRRGRWHTMLRIHDFMDYTKKLCHGGIIQKHLVICVYFLCENSGWNMSANLIFPIPAQTKIVPYLTLCTYTNTHAPTDN